MHNPSGSSNYRIRHLPHGSKMSRKKHRCLDHFFQFHPTNIGKIVENMGDVSGSEPVSNAEEKGAVAVLWCPGIKDLKRT